MHPLLSIHISPAVTSDKIVQTADPEPVIAIGIEDQIVPSLCRPAGCADLSAGRSSHYFSGRHPSHRLSPACGGRLDCGRRGSHCRAIHSGSARRCFRRVDDFIVAPADFRHFLAQPDDAFRPVQKRFRLDALARDVDAGEIVGPVGNRWAHRLWPRR